jgi:hypothetical protein
MSVIKKFKTKVGIKEKKKIDHESLKAICKMIKEEHPEWSELNDDILIMFLKLTIRQYPPDQFDNMPEEELREKIRNAFVNMSKNNKDLRSVASPEEILKLNAAYLNGKKLGVSGKKMLNVVSKKLFKSSEKQLRLGKDQKPPETEPNL